MDDDTEPTLDDLTREAGYIYNGNGARTHARIAAHQARSLERIADALERIAGDG